MRFALGHLQNKIYGLLWVARVLTKIENAVKVEPVGEFELKGIRRPLAVYNVVAALA